MESNSIYDYYPDYDYRDGEQKSDDQISKRRGNSFGEILKRGVKRMLRKPFVNVKPITHRQDVLGTVGNAAGDLAGAVGDLVSFAGANLVRCNQNQFQ